MQKQCAAAIIREYGLKQTAGREALLTVLLNAGKPLSHREIKAKMLSYQYDPVSIYRSLEAFVTAGLAHRIETEERTWLFAICTCGREGHCHPHFFCRSCGKCECLSNYMMPDIDDLGGGYIIEERRYYVKGICSSCAGSDHEASSRS